MLVMRTAEDAVKAKYAAVQTGYYHDPYIAAFYPAFMQKRPPPVQVIIKRGTFARVVCVNKAISSFVAAALNASDGGNIAQVVVLGAGKDTSFFRLLQSELLRDAAVKWFEVDHDEVFREKVTVIERFKSLFGAKIEKNGRIYEVQSAGSTPWPASCHLIPFDLKENPASLIETLKTLGMTSDAPTLIVCECVQMYLPTEAVGSLLNAFCNACSDCHICSYEPILGSDSFGKMMEGNLTKAGVAHPGSCLVQTRTLHDYLNSMKRAGFVCSTGCDMYAAYETIVPASERLAANKCEFLDELEEWILIMRHYCFVVASNNVRSAVGERFTAVGSDSSFGFTEGRCEQLR